MTDVFYLSTDGQEFIERTSKITESYWQDRDGLHPISHDSVWQDSNRLKQGRMVILERATPAFGSRMTHNDLALLYKEQQNTQAEFKYPTVNKRLWRQLAALFAWLSKYGIMILLGVGIGALVIYQLFGHGGMFGGT